MEKPKFTVPGMEEDDAVRVLRHLEQRLTGLLDLGLTLKHVHWNVVGVHFIGVHEMLDTQVEGVHAMVDAMAERMATLGGVPRGTPGAIVEIRDWEDYPLGRATVGEHLAELDKVYVGVITDHRKVQAKLAELDPVSEDMIIGQLADLELYHWFVRAHLETAGGALRDGDS